MRRSALVVAHPGHELRVFGWYERVRPQLFVLTTGSRNGTDGRLSFSRSLAARTGAPLGSLFGGYLDRQIYNALLARDPALFVEWTGALYEEFLVLDPGLVVVDGWQMYNVAHDLVHVMTRVAAGHAANRLGHAIDVVEYQTVPRELSIVSSTCKEAFRIELDEAAFMRKVSAAAECPDLQAEIEQLLSLESFDAHRTESYRHPPTFDGLMPPPSLVPPYEIFGHERVAAGIYRECIRWKEHVQPIVEAIREV